MPRHKLNTADVLNATVLLGTAKDLGGVLRGWKEIAQFLRVSVASAIRYQKERGLPIGYIGRTPLTTPLLISRWILEQKKGINPARGD